jgi:hypothetical protein
MVKLKTNQYQCYRCKNIFEKGLTDKEAEEQLDKEFSWVGTEDCELVCDDCYKEMFE